MTGRCSVGGLYSTEFAFLVIVGAVIGVVDEIQKDGPRPGKVEDFHGLIREEFVGSLFEVILINRMEPLSDDIVDLGANLLDRRLTDSSTDDDRPDIAGIERRILDPWQGKVADLGVG